GLWWALERPEPAALMMRWYLGTGWFWGQPARALMWSVRDQPRSVRARWMAGLTPPRPMMAVGPGGMPACSRASSVAVMPSKSVSVACQPVGVRRRVLAAGSWCGFSTWGWSRMARFKGEVMERPRNPSWWRRGRVSGRDLAVVGIAM